ncbi:MAG: hypothetical protein QG608_410 [Actinomycetota bacterium]|nr:hypothetical protein [Actinomycetota bacterium]
MTVTAPMTGPAAGLPGHGPRLPNPPHDRRPALAALAVLLIVAGALGSGLIAYRSGGRSDVLVAAHEILPGHVVTADDFTIARVAADPGSVVAASARSNFIGTSATARIPAGTLINRTMFLSGQVMPANALVVGVVVNAQQRPARQLQAGDVVRAYLVGTGGSLRSTTAQGAGTPDQDNTPTSLGALQAGDILLKATRVVEVHGNSSPSQPATVSLLVPSNAAAGFVPAAAESRVALVRLSPSVTPDIDFRKR